MDKVYAQTVIMKVLMDRITPNHNLKTELESLCALNPKVAISDMGVSVGRQDSPLQ